MGQNVLLSTHATLDDLRHRSSSLKGLLLGDAWLDQICPRTAGELARAQLFLDEDVVASDHVVGATPG